MKVVYLRANTKEALTTDLQKMFPEWDGVTMDFSNEHNCHAHFIGQVPDKTEWFANVLCSDQEAEVFEHTVEPDPETPYHVFLGWEPVIE